MKKTLLLILLSVTASITSGTSWAANEKVVIDVKAMTCPLCVTVVNQVLRETDGVIKAKGSLKTHQAYAIVPQGFDTDKLLSAIDKTGYTGKINHIDTMSDQ